MSPETAESNIRRAGRTSRRRAWLITAVIAIVAGAGLTVFLISSAKDAELQNRLAFPATWTSATPDMGLPWEGGEIQLMSDGSARLANIPMGSVVERAGARCVEQTNLFTGTGSWEQDSVSSIVITVEDGQTRLLASGGKFGSIDWRDTEIRMCGNQASALFGLRSELLSYHGR